jgi:hypothetical protein
MDCVSDLQQAVSRVIFENLCVPDVTPHRGGRPGSRAQVRRRMRADFVAHADANEKESPFTDIQS